jgi:mono/diheme cytochrome c family protein
MLNIGPTFDCAEDEMRGCSPISHFVGFTLPWVMVAGLAASPTDAINELLPNDGNADAEREEFFETKVRPLLADNCLECHGAEQHKGGLRLDVRDGMLRGGDGGPVVKPGKPAESVLIEAIRHEGDVRMPPKKRLKDEEIAILTKWVKQGTFWPASRPQLGARAGTNSTAGANEAAEAKGASRRDRAFWSFQPLDDPAPPSFADDTWTRSPIDRFILAKQQEKSLAPAPGVDRSTLIRRASFDLIGLPPTPEEITDFIQDNSPGAFGKVVDRLLASPHYGERWGRYWLDVARYGEDQAHSFQPRLYPYGFRYRDWVIRALNSDMPYDQFVREQIAGDLITGANRLDHLAALGFFACGPVYYGDSKKHDQYADRIDTLTRGFLGLTVACARCHDHKYDPIPTDDYYALAGVFASSEYIEAPTAPEDVVKAYDKAQTAIKTKEKEITSCLKVEAERLKLKVPGDQLKQVERLMPHEAKAKLKELRTELDRLKKNAPPKYPVIHTLGDASHPTDMPVFVRGNPETAGPKVPRRFLGALGGDRSPFQHGSGRLELAQAIANHALTARVMVNRIWQHHFGLGLVATPSNFGALGEQPSHPELLEWLAHRFVASGQSIKSLHRTIMLSASYQQSSRFDSKAFTSDPGNVLLWRMNRRRLDVEAWRDAMLAVAGQLDSTIGGPSVSLDGPSNHRRTVYAAISRHDLAWMLRLFDFPDPNITSGGRVETTIPLQQLFVLNGDLVTASAGAVAARLQAPAQPDATDARRIRQAYLLLYGRAVTERELQIGLAYLQVPTAAVSSSSAGTSLSRWERYAQALLAANEFLFID